MDFFDIPELDYTEAAWNHLYDAVDDEKFLQQDAILIYNSLKYKLKFISFGDYLKRYIYVKMGLEGPASEIPLQTYQQIIKDSFRETYTPPSFSPTTAKLSALSKNWLTQQTVKRNVVLLLGFGLKMSVEDVNTFLTKALREPEINPKNPFEVICWYCYKNSLNYADFYALWEKFSTLDHASISFNTIYSEHTMVVKNTLYSIDNEDSLMAYLSRLTTKENIAHMSITSRKCFNELYSEAREIVANIYNDSEDERHHKDLVNYQDRLQNSDRLYDYEKIERIEKFRDNKRVFTKDDITESDIEHIICSAIPTDRHGNLTPSKASQLNEQFAGKRFSRQRISEILMGNSEITRFDLITLNFFIYSQKTNEYPDAKQRYSKFLNSTNEILEKCSMGAFYVQNPYECFVLMCILTLDPLGTYADVWELSYDKE